MDNINISNEIINNFSNRAYFYNLDAWVSDVNLIEPIVPKPFGSKKALDLCAGTGAISNYCFQLGWDVTALDANELMLNQITNKQIHKVVGNIEYLPFSNNEFDVVICRQGLQYTEINRAFSEIIRVSNNQICLGHITTYQYEEIEFWKEYFEIVTPGRKVIFYPSQIKEIACANGLNLLCENIINVYSSINGHIVHLNDESKKYVLSYICKADINIINSYNIECIGDIVSMNHRWEFLRFSKFQYLPIINMG